LPRCDPKKSGGGESAARRVREEVTTALPRRRNAMPRGHDRTACRTGSSPADWQEARAGLLPESWSMCYESPRRPARVRKDATMKTKTYTPEQIIKLLRSVEAGQAEGKTVEEMCRTLGIADSTYHRWRNQYGAMKADEVKRLKELERENERLKKLVADLSLDNQILKEVARGN
jgi:putative transposase